MYCWFQRIAYQIWTTSIECGHMHLLNQLTLTVSSDRLWPKLCRDLNVFKISIILILILNQTTYKKTTCKTVKFIQPIKYSLPVPISRSRSHVSRRFRRFCWAGNPYDGTSSSSSSGFSSDSIICCGPMSGLLNVAWRRLLGVVVLIVVAALFDEIPPPPVRGALSPSVSLWMLYRGR